ncbi:hypothetical protein AVEN_110491-1 [Araneus ventricosus]|uniref:Secreted protein n=1 Tax=Araneus ventricosus TaxID=182803 RepID=A0A4Y2VL62_ARAVE|nr:hypothetical protein AVEN_110491-1 [Araneus ventricosus]
MCRHWVPAIAPLLAAHTAPVFTRVAYVMEGPGATPLCVYPSGLTRRPAAPYGSLVTWPRGFPTVRGIVSRPEEHHPPCVSIQIIIKTRQKIARHCGPAPGAPITGGSTWQPHFTRGCNMYRKGPKEPHHHYCAAQVGEPACLCGGLPKSPQTQVSPDGDGKPEGHPLPASQHSDDCE